MLGPTAWPSSGGGGGVTSIGAFGSTPNANGGSISGTTLTLQPADLTHPGGILVGDQTISMPKTFKDGSSNANIVLTTIFNASVAQTQPFLNGLDQNANQNLSVGANFWIYGATGGVGAPVFNIYDAGSGYLCTIQIDGNGGFLFNPQGGLSTFTGQITCAALDVSLIYGNLGGSTVLIDVDNHNLKDASGITSVGWANRILHNSGSSTGVLDWDNLQLFDGSAIKSMDWGLRIIYDSAAVESLNYDSRFAYDISDVKSIDWDNRLLTNQSATTTVDWNNLDLYSSGEQVVQWGLQILADSSGLNSADWGSRLLIDSAGFNSVNWEGRVLILSGVGVMDWSLLVLNDSTSSASVSWGSRTLSNTSSQVVMDWQNGFINSGTALSIDFVNRALFDGAHYSLDYQNRLILDLNGAPVFSWQGTQMLGFFGVTSVAQPTSSGSQTAGIIYSSTEQTMLQQVYDAVRVLGLMS